MEQLAIINQPQLKAKIADVRSGDTVRVHQTIREGNKTRVQVFEGVVIRTQRLNSVGASITVRKISSNIGVEKTWFMHSPNVVKVDIMRRSKVRRSLLSYMRARRGKSARLAELEFDRERANTDDSRTNAEISAEQEIQNSVNSPDIAQSSADDVLSQPDTESTDELVKGENKSAKADDEVDIDDNEKIVEAVEAEAGNDRVENKTKN